MRVGEDSYCLLPSTLGVHVLGAHDVRSLWFVKGRPARPGRETPDTGQLSEIMPSADFVNSPRAADSFFARVARGSHIRRPPRPFYQPPAGLPAPASDLPLSSTEIHTMTTRIVDRAVTLIDCKTEVCAHSCVCVYVCVGVCVLGPRGCDSAPSRDTISRVDNSPNCVEIVETSLTKR